jgi:hypothetical protein
VKPGTSNFQFSPGEQHRQELLAEAAEFARVAQVERQSEPPIRSDRVRPTGRMMLGAIATVIASLRVRRLLTSGGD